MLRVAVFGCGYVGLVTGACLAKLGHEVCCYDVDATRIWMLQRGEVPFYEPGLEELVAEQKEAARLAFTDDPADALRHAALAFIAVGTPTGPTGEADLTYVRQAAREIAASASGHVIVVNKSTVPVETADLVERILSEHGNPAYRFSVASNPEFLREGSAIADFLHPDRIVIGSANTRAIAVLQEVYAPLGASMHVVDVRTAEMIKYAANTFLATKISFANEIANVCRAVGADVDRVMAGIGADPRIGDQYLEPGLGFGGSCLPKDVAALVSVARHHAIEPTMLEATLAVNRRQIATAVRLIEGMLGDVCDRPLALCGLAFKGGTDDVRDSPAVVLAQAMLTRGAQLAVYDSHALRGAHMLLRERVRYADSVYDACEGAAALIVGNDDPGFEHIDWSRVRTALDGDVTIDLRNRISPSEVRRAGLRYAGLGRARSKVEA